VNLAGSQHVRGIIDLHFAQLNRISDHDDACIVAVRFSNRRRETLAPAPHRRYQLGCQSPHARLGEQREVIACDFKDFRPWATTAWPAFRFLTIEGWQRPIVYGFTHREAYRP
jgi:hypothetical protein